MNRMLPPPAVFSRSALRRRVILSRATPPVPARAYVLALVLAVVVAAGCAYPLGGFALVGLVIVALVTGRIIARPFIGLTTALWIFPFYPALRAAYTAYHIPIAFPGSRIWCEALFSVLFAGLFVGAIKGRNARFTLRWDDTPAVVFLLGGVYATVVDFVDHAAPAVPFWGWYMSLNTALFYFAVRWMRPTEAAARRLLATFFGSFTVLGLLSLADYLLRPTVGWKLADASRPYFVPASWTPELYWKLYPRMQSLMFDENLWGTLCAFVSLYCLASFLTPRAPLRRVRWLLPLALVGMAASMSRGSFLCFGVGVAVLLLARGSHRPRIIAAIVAVLFVGGWAMTAFGSDPRISYLMRRANTLGATATGGKKGEQQETAASDRQFQWIAGWKIFTENPSGRGLGTVGNAAHLSKYGPPIVADGLYFRILAEQGLPGFLAVMFSFFGMLWMLFRNLPACTGATRVLGLTLLAFLSGQIVQSIGANTFDFYYLPALFWMFTGLFLTLCERERQAAAVAAIPLLAGGE